MTNQNRFSRSAVSALKIWGLTLLLWPTLGNAGVELPPGVNVVEIGVGSLYLKGASPLYAYRRDRQAKNGSVCNESCSETWLPFHASSGTQEFGVWTIIKRDDGSSQWAFRGQPVYTNVSDGHKGSMVGEKDPYWDPVVDPIDTPPTISIRGTVAGQIFVDVNSRALYWKLDESGCEENCVENYSPLEAAWSASPPNNNWSIIVMENGLKQWAYKAHALYTAKSDYRSGDLTGRDEKLGWHAAVIQAPEALPEWVRLQETDMGPVVANEEGKTLYYIPDNRDRVLRETCNEKCVDENWTAVEAASNARPVGNWSVVELNGKRLWWYLGLPVYTYKNDLVPGDIFGEKFGAGAHGRAGWRAILSEKLVQNLVQYN